MKRHLASLLAASALLLAAHPTWAAAQPKAPKDTATLVAALQAVSPDPLGGRLGLDLASRTPALKVETTGGALAAQPIRPPANARPSAATKSAPKS
jgi:hypothetical protein